jgi:integrase
MQEVPPRSTRGRASGGPLRLASGKRCSPFPQRLPSNRSRPDADGGRGVRDRGDPVGRKVDVREIEDGSQLGTGPVIPFHYLRHCCASWLLGAGMDVAGVSERLGHWSPSLTLSVYAHAIRGRQAELARVIGSALK